MRDEEAARLSCLPEILAGPGRVPVERRPEPQHGRRDADEMADAPNATALQSADVEATASMISASSSSPSSPSSPSLSPPSSSSSSPSSSPSSPPLPPSANLLPPPPIAILSSRPPVPSLPTVSSLSPAPASPASPSGARAYPHLSQFQRWTLRASDSEFNALSGAVGGFMSGIVTCPLDVIKTKLQAQGGFASQAGQSHHRIYNGLVGTARVIWQDEGPRGLYRGLGPIIMGYLPTWAVWFTVYNKSKAVLGETYHNAFVISFCSALVAGASSTIVTNPIWVIKTRLMSQMPHGRGDRSQPRGGNTPTSRPMLHTPWHYRSTWDAARTMYTTEGILSFYSGLTPALLGLSHVAVQFPAYEFLKTKFTGGGMGDSGDDGDSTHWFGVLSATILSKVMASSLTYPHEVIRTRLQTQRRPAGSRIFREARAKAKTTDSSRPVTGTAPAVTAAAGPVADTPAVEAPPRYRGVITTFRTILREEGWRAFYAGLGTNMMRAVPAATVTMLTYEHTMRKLRHTRHEAQMQMQLQGS